MSHLEPGTSAAIYPVIIIVCPDVTLLNHSLFTADATAFKPVIVSRRRRAHRWAGSNRELSK
jgi:hypothetical protein